MKTRIKARIILILSLLMFSCDYETHVVNTVHTDGSVSRTVTMQNSESKFEPSAFKVPVDSTWNMVISPVTNEKQDTVSWLLTAKKEFAGVDEINREYAADSGSNHFLKRSASFTRYFRWFYTSYRYSEKIGNILLTECPVEDFLTEEQLRFYYYPEEVRHTLLNGSDSLTYRKLESETDSCSERWIWSVFYREWTMLLFDSTGVQAGPGLDREAVKRKENEVIAMIIADTSASDDSEEAVFRYIVGDEAFEKYRPAIDSSVKLLEKRMELLWAARSYGMEIRMPGTIYASNGYAGTPTDSLGSGGIFWTVEGSYFLNEPFEMWVESRINNYWAWGATAFFVLFVLAGFILRKRPD
ncbi:MAG: hypothetical protein ACOYXB_14770 [Bacteroidota bacterium]